MRREVRRRFRADYKYYKGHGGYDAVGELWGVSSGVAWKMCNEKNYWPTDEKIQWQIKNKARELGIIVSRRKRDLWSMSPEELKWRLKNREEVS